MSAAKHNDVSAGSPQRFGISLDQFASLRAHEVACLDAFETVAWDYRASGHSPRAHPLAPLREKLRAKRFPDARAVSALPHGRRIHYAGLVICRQRPGTASGVVFLTLEDETGFVNVVAWSDVYERHRVLVKTSSFLGVTGRIQAEDEAVPTETAN